MALNTTKWLDTFAENLYPSNAFYSGSVNDSRYAQNKTVIIPNYSEEVTVFDMVAAPITGARTLKTLTHAEKTYTMTQYGVDPYIVDPVEDNEFSYDKRKAVLDQAIMKLKDSVGFKILWDWTIESTGSILSTSGTATRANRFGNTAIKRLVFADLLEAQTQLNLQNVPSEGRRLIVDAYGLQDIQVMAELVGSAALTEKSFADGAVMRVAGFDVFMRSETVGFTLAGAKKAIGAAVLATDLGTAVAYHPSLVRHSVGTKDNSGIKVFIGEEDPAIYGRAMSAYTRVAGSTSYAEVANVTKGVIVIKESK